MQSHQQFTIDLSRYGCRHRVILASLVLAYLLLIVYGSLLPFARNDLTFDEAWINFQHIPFLKLGVGSRADLVANLLLYIPFGFLLCGFLVGRSRHPLMLITGMVISLMFSIVIAVAVEFTQQFFSPRTVSLNDLYAEFAGASLGIVLWPTVGMRCIQLAQTIFRGGDNARHAVLVVYALAYFVLSFMPYDLLLTPQEWQRKLMSDHVGWVFAPLCGSGCVWKLIPEALAVIPLSILFFRSVQPAPLILAAITGALFGVLIEGLQLLIASGVSQGASIVSRTIGMMLGVLTMRFIHKIDWYWVRQYTRSILILLILPYLGALALVNRWFTSSWLGLSEGIARLDEVRFMPFYYHYYTTELAALVSLLFHTTIYAPVGFGFWLWHWVGWSTSTKRNNGLWAGMTAGVLACVIETGKLFVPTTHPDPTDILIAIMSAAITYRLLNLLFVTRPIIGKHNLATKPGSIQAETDKDNTHTARFDKIALVGTQRPWWATIAGAIALGLTLVAAVTSPLDINWVLPLVALYMALLWRWPGFWLVGLLALLPLLDLTPWSGRLYWTEYDTILLASIGIGYLRLCSDNYTQPIFYWPAKLLLILLAFSATISLGIGILPLGEIDHNAFSNYYSGYNGLRIAKGLLFAFALIPLLAREWENPNSAVRRLALGMSLGLAAEVLYILWERITFSGLFNFESDYRITGSFHGMHVGGAYIETYLAIALPFVALWAWLQRNIWITVLAVGLYGLGTYSIMVTFSRGGQIAFILATLIMMLGLMRFSFQGSTRRLASISALVLIGLITLATAWPVITGKYSQARWQAIEQDFVKRTDHWKDVMQIFQSQSRPVFGVGLGSFPLAYYWDSRAPSRPATFSFITEDKNTFLQLGSGNQLYFEQSVAVEPAQRYTLTVNLRSNTNKAGLAVFVCEKSIIYSYACIYLPFRIIEQTGQWLNFEAQIYIESFGPSGTLFQRPVKLSLFNNRKGTLIDVDNVALYDPTGNNLVRNGNFSNGMHHWFFSADDYWPWHVENLFLSILFEQGWFGLICFVALIAYALIRWLPRACYNDPFRLTLCASVTAFLTVGLLSSWNDEPRLSFLFYLLLITGLVADRQLASSRHVAVTNRKYKFYE